MTESRQLTLPITGMTCANCVATVERNLKKLDGVQGAVVNLSSERATVEFDTVKLHLEDLIARVERAGYGVATGEAELVIQRLSDDHDARRLETALRKLEGVLEVQTYGDLLHVLVDNAGHRQEALLQALERAGIAVASLRQTRPRMEEAFISLVQRQMAGRSEPGVGQ